MQLSTTLSTLLAAVILLSAGCSSIPFIGGKNKDRECEYRNVYSVGTIEKIEGENIHFQITGYREVVRTLDQLSTAFSYEEGKRYQVRQKFLVKGNCERYQLEILGAL